MIIETKKLLFIHIPKAAGTSISQYFMRLDGKKWFNEKHREQYYASKKYGHGHYPYSKYLERFKYIDFNNYIKFTIVRNPWDRLWSEWNWWFFKIKKQKPVLIKQDFYQFVYLLTEKIKKYDYNWFAFDQNNILPGQSFHVIPQYLFITNLSNQIDNSIEILRFENLQKDFSAFCIKHDLPITTLPLVNKSTLSVNYHDVYDNATEKLVAELYRKDIELLHYEFI